MMVPKKIFASLAISLCAMLAGIAALFMAPAGEGNVSQAAGTMDVSISNSAGGNAYIGAATTYNETSRTWVETAYGPSTKSLTLYNSVAVSNGSCRTIFCAVPNSGYVVKSWEYTVVSSTGVYSYYILTGTGSSPSTTRTTSVTASTVLFTGNQYSLSFCCNAGSGQRIVKVNFELDPSRVQSLTVNAGAGGTIDSGYGSRTVVNGSTVDLRATANASHVFSNWEITSGQGNATLHNSGSATNASITVNGDVTVRANFSPKTVYQLTTSVSPTSTAGSITRSISGQSGSNGYYSGTSVTLTANPNTGYKISSWVVTRNGISTTYSGTTTRAISMTADTSVVANFELKDYTLNTVANPGAGGAVLRDVVKSSYTHGESVVLTAAAEIGYELAGWTVARTGLSTLTHGAVTSITVNMQANTSVTANFNKKTYTLSGSNFTRNPNRTIYEHGTEVVLTATVPTGQEVTGWTVTQNGTIANYPASSTLTITMLGETTVVPNFQVKKYTLETTVQTYDGSLPISAVGGSISKSPSASTYDHGTSVALTANPATGYEITGWVVSKTGSSNVLYGAVESIDVVMDASTTVTVKFAKMYTLETEGLNSGDSGGDVSLASSGVNLSSATNGQISFEPKQDYYSYNDPVTIVFTADDGYYAQSYSVYQNGEFVNTVTFTNKLKTQRVTNFRMTADTVITAVFAPNEYILKVVVSPATAGEVTVDGSVVVGGTTTLQNIVQNREILVSARTISGYAIQSWTLSGVSVNLVDVGTGTDTNATKKVVFNGLNSGTVTLTIKLHIPSAKYRVIAQGSPEVGGTASTTEGEFHEYSYRDTTRVTAYPEPGYSLVGWTISGGEFTDTNATATSRTIIVWGNVIVTALFSGSYTLTGEAIGEGTVDVTKTSGITNIEDIVVRAIPASGWRIASWTIDNGTFISANDADTIRTVRISSDAIVTVTFAENYTLTANTSTPEGGSITSVSKTYDILPNQEVEIRSMPIDGYKVTGWTVTGADIVSGGGTNENCIVRVTANATVTVHFGIIVYSLTTVASPAEACAFEITSGKTSDYVYGDRVTIRVALARGYRFDGWDDATSASGFRWETGTSTTLERTLTITGEATVRAVFTYVGGINDDEPDEIEAVLLSATEPENVDWYIYVGAYGDGSGTQETRRIISSDYGASHVVRFNAGFGQTFSRLQIAGRDITTHIAANADSSTDYTLLDETIGYVRAYYETPQILVVMVRQPETGENIAGIASIVATTKVLPRYTITYDVNVPEVDMKYYREYVPGVTTSFEFPNLNIGSDNYIIYEGYRQDGWMLHNVLATNENLALQSGNITLTARWVALTNYRISYANLGDSYKNDFLYNEDTAQHGYATALTGPSGVYEGYDFVGWSLTQGGDAISGALFLMNHAEGLLESETAEKNFTLYAIWTPTLYKVYLPSTRVGYTILNASAEIVNGKAEVAHGNDFVFQIQLDSDYNRTPPRVMIGTTEGSSIEGYESRINDTTYQYRIPKIVAEQFVSIEVYKNGYQVYYVADGSGYTIVIPDGVTLPIEHGESFMFYVEIHDSHSKSVPPPQIIYVMNGERYFITEPWWPQAPYSANNQIFWYIIENVTGDIYLNEVTGITLNEYSVDWESGNDLGYRLFGESGEGSPVTNINHGSDFEFYVILDEEYSMTAPVVTIYNQTRYSYQDLERISISGERTYHYVIRNISGDLTIFVDVEYNEYVIDLPLDSNVKGFKASAVDGFSSPVRAGDPFHFYIDVLEGYTNSTPLVTHVVNGQAVTLQPTVGPLVSPRYLGAVYYSYELVAIGDAYISVNNVVLNTYFVDFTLGNCIDDCGETGISAIYAEPGYFKDIVSAGNCATCGVYHLTDGYHVTHGYSFQFRVVLDSMHNKSLGLRATTIVTNPVNTMNIVSTQLPAAQSAQWWRVGDGQYTYFGNVSLTGETTIAIAGVINNTYALTPVSGGDCELGCNGYSYVLGLNDHNHMMSFIPHTEPGVVYKLGIRIAEDHDKSVPRFVAKTETGAEIATFTLYDEYDVQQYSYYYDDENGYYVLVITGVDRDVWVTIHDITKNKWTINIDKSEGFYINVSKGGPQWEETVEIYEGENFRFTLDLWNSHSRSNFTIVIIDELGYVTDDVLAGPHPVTGLYTIPEIRGDKYIVVQGIEINEYEVSWLAADDKYTFNPIESRQVDDYDNITELGNGIRAINVAHTMSPPQVTTQEFFEFTVDVDAAYSQIANSLVVKSIISGGSAEGVIVPFNIVNGVKVYRLTVDSDMRISIEMPTPPGWVKNKYNVTWADDPTHYNVTFDTSDEIVSMAGDEKGAIVTHGNDFTFTVNRALLYSKQAITVKLYRYEGNSLVYTGIELNPREVGGSTYVISRDTLTQDLRVVISPYPEDLGWQISKHLVELIEDTETGEDRRFEIAPYWPESSDMQFQYGSDVYFTVTVAQKYSQNNISDWLQATNDVAVRLCTVEEADVFGMTPKADLSDGRVRYLFKVEVTDDTEVSVVGTWGLNDYDITFVPDEYGAVTFWDEDGLVQIVSDVEDIIHGGSYSFRINVDPYYASSDVRVYAGGVRLDAVGGLYTISNMRSDVRVTLYVDLKFTVDLIDDEGYELDYTPGTEESYPVNNTGEYTFTVTLEEDYSKSAFVVEIVKFKPDGTFTTTYISRNQLALGGAKNTFVYTINVEGNLEISVSGVVLNTFKINLAKDVQDSNDEPIYSMEVFSGSIASLADAVTDSGVTSAQAWQEGTNLDYDEIYWFEVDFKTAYQRTGDWSGIIPVINGVDADDNAYDGIIEYFGPYELESQTKYLFGIRLSGYQFPPDQVISITVRDKNDVWKPADRTVTWGISFLNLADNYFNLAPITHTANGNEATVSHGDVFSFYVTVLPRYTQNEIILTTITNAGLPVVHEPDSDEPMPDGSHRYVYTIVVRGDVEILVGSAWDVNTYNVEFVPDKNTRARYDFRDAIPGDYLPFDTATNADGEEVQMVKIYHDNSNGSTDGGTVEFKVWLDTPYTNWYESMKISYSTNGINWTDVKCINNGIFGHVCNAGCYYRITDVNTDIKVRVDGEPRQNEYKVRYYQNQDGYIVAPLACVCTTENGEDACVSDSCAITGQGYAVQNDTSSYSVVKHGEKFAFTVTILASHNRSYNNIVINVGGVQYGGVGGKTLPAYDTAEYAATGNLVFTFNHPDYAPEITGLTWITVHNVEKNNYRLWVDMHESFFLERYAYETQGAWTLSPMGSNSNQYRSSALYFDDTYYFSVKLKDGYTDAQSLDAALWVTIGGQTSTVQFTDAFGSFREITAEVDGAEGVFYYVLRITDPTVSLVEFKVDNPPLKNNYLIDAQSDLYPDTGLGEEPVDRFIIKILANEGSVRWDEDAQQWRVDHGTDYSFNVYLHEAYYDSANELPQHDVFVNGLTANYTRTGPFYDSTIAGYNCYYRYSVKKETVIIDQEIRVSNIIAKRAYEITWDGNATEWTVTPAPGLPVAGTDKWSSANPVPHGEYFLFKVEPKQGFTFPSNMSQLVVKLGNADRVGIQLYADENGYYGATLPITESWVITVQGMVELLHNITLHEGEGFTAHGTKTALDRSTYQFMVTLLNENLDEWEIIIRATMGGEEVEVKQILTYGNVIVYEISSVTGDVEVEIEVRAIDNGPVDPIEDPNPNNFTWLWILVIIAILVLLAVVVIVLLMWLRRKKEKEGEV